MTFRTAGEVYSLDELNAKNLIVNIELLRSCIEEQSLYIEEVVNAVEPVQ